MATRSAICSFSKPPRSTQGCRRTAIGDQLYAGSASRIPILAGDGCPPSEVSAGPSLGIWARRQSESVTEGQQDSVTQRRTEGIDLVAGRANERRVEAEALR